MDMQSVQGLTSAIAPIVLVSAAGLLYNGVQTKNLHLSDRIRALTAELRHPATTPARRRQVLDQLPHFARRIRLSQQSLEMLYLAMVCFVLTSLLLAALLWVGLTALPGVIATLFVIGVGLLIAALGLEFVEMWIGLKTIAIETRDSGDYR
jgi:hypothetical protein